MIRLSNRSFLMKIFFTLLFILIASSSFSQANDIRAFHNGDYDRKYIVDKKIKNIKVSSTSNNQKSLSFYFYFDPSGLLEKETIINSKDEQQSEFLFFYNEQGQQVKRISKNFETNKTLV